jgi:pullulanase/glycogen debranching enzyme
LPHWTDPKEKQFACLIDEDQKNALFLMFNAVTEAVGFKLPPLPSGARWHLAVDTSRETPGDLNAEGGDPLSEEVHTYLLCPRSAAILLAR